MPEPNVIRGPIPKEGMKIREGETWEVRGKLECHGSISVFGQLDMTDPEHPGHIDFPDINESRFKGGPGYLPLSDVGIWVREHGRLNWKLPTPPKQVWGYGLSSHSTWDAGDDMVQAPQTVKEINKTTGYEVHHLGDSVPECVDGVATPVFNLTQPLKVSGRPGGRSHIHINSSASQIIDGVEVSYMGVPGKLGRYPIHFHECACDDTGEHGPVLAHGSIVQNFVTKHSGHHAVVVHMADGVEIRNGVMYDTLEDPLWYDPKTNTNRLHYQNLAVGWVRPEAGSVGRRLSGARLARGFGNAYEDMFLSGVLGSEGSSGLHWSEGDSGIGGLGVWEGKGNNRIQACSHNGVFVWQNTGNIHEVVGSGTLTIVGCGKHGIESGAYRHGYQFKKINIWCPPGATGILNHGVPNSKRVRPDGYNHAWEDVTVHGGATGFQVTKHTLPAGQPVLLKNVRFEGQTGKKLVVNEKVNGGKNIGCPYDVVDCDVRPTDVKVISAIGPNPAKQSPGFLMRIQTGNEAWSINHYGLARTINRFYSHP